jgi:hypothetical protein
LAPFSPFSGFLCKAKALDVSTLRYNVAIILCLGGRKDQHPTTKLSLASDEQRLRSAFRFSARFDRRMETIAW